MSKLPTIYKGSQTEDYRPTISRVNDVKFDRIKIEGRSLLVPSDMTPALEDSFNKEYEARHNLARIASNERAGERGTPVGLVAGLIAPTATILASEYMDNQTIDSIADYFRSNDTKEILAHSVILASVATTVAGSILGHYIGRGVGLMVSPLYSNQIKKQAQQDTANAIKARMSDVPDFDIR